ncbi:MAG: thiolase family protein [Elusimicrobia bacterium]|nr:thiolase family protein [Elusimicrobiota bacterium]
MKLSSDDPIVIIDGARTPIGQVAKALAGVTPVDLMTQAVKNLTAKLKIDPAIVESCVIGWVGQDVSAPNIARVTILKSGLRTEIPGFTVQCNCVSSIEAVASAAKQILAGEASVVLAGGVESMSTFPYTIQGSRANKALRSMQTVKDQWANLWNAEGVKVSDTTEQGLTDPIRSINMAGTAEVCAQIYDVSRDEQDQYTIETFKRCVEGQKRGFYKTHVQPFSQNGATLLESDEYPQLRASLVEKPALVTKAPVLFDSPAYTFQNFWRDFGKYVTGKTAANGAKPSVTLFNSCPRSDGASAVLVTRLSKAKTLKLPTSAIVRSWSFYGNDPAHMGVGPALAADEALQRAQISFDKLDQIELHEPFAATVLSIFKLGQQKFGHNWNAKWKDKKLNPNGGTLAMGHPLGATGTRLLLNLIYAFKENSSSKYGLIAGCSGGGIGAAMIFEKA